MNVCFAKRDRSATLSIGTHRLGAKRARTNHMGPSPPNSAALPLGFGLLRARHLVLVPRKCRELVGRKHRRTEARPKLLAYQLEKIGRKRTRGSTQVIGQQALIQSAEQQPLARAVVFNALLVEHAELVQLLLPRRLDCGVLMSWIDTSSDVTSL